MNTKYLGFGAAVMLGAVLITAPASAQWYPGPVTVVLPPVVAPIVIHRPVVVPHVVVEQPRVVVEQPLVLQQPFVVTGYVEPVYTDHVYPDY